MSEPTAPNPTKYQAFLQLLRTADTVWNASREFFEPWEIGPSQFNVLNLLRGTPQGLTQTELSRELIMHRSNVTGLVDRLEKRGLVERHDVEGDRRAYRVVLSTSGERLIAEILPRYYGAADRLWEGLGESRLRNLTAALREAARNAERIAGETKTTGDPYANHRNQPK
jgi:MarR family 2-MHQ and catechol resistance regulon transcriptional repressor